MVLKFITANLNVQSLIIETGSQVQAAIRLLEKQGATIIGIASISIDDNEATAKIKKKYRCHTVR